jgi:hypothetical protein
MIFQSSLWHSNHFTLACRSVSRNRKLNVASFAVQYNRDQSPDMDMTANGGQNFQIFFSIFLLDFAPNTHILTQFRKKKLIYVVRVLNTLGSANGAACYVLCIHKEPRKRISVTGFHWSNSSSRRQSFSRQNRHTHFEITLFILVMFFW